MTTKQDNPANPSREDRRKMMPKTTEFIDAIRKEFGYPVAIDARENGQEISWRANA